MAHIRIICDGGGEYGFGNLRRSVTLAERFRLFGHSILIQPLSDRARDLLPLAPQEQDWNDDLWLLDLPYAGDAWVSNARAGGRPVVALDFIGALSPDLIISAYDHGHAPAGARHLIGPQFAIVREDILALSPAMPGEGVIVIIGGGDEVGLGETVATRLAMLGQTVTLIDGPLAKVTQELPQAVTRHASPPELASLMSRTAWSVTSGGGTMFEMMCLGKAVFVVPRTRFEESLARSIFAKGAILGVGLNNLQEPSAERVGTVARKARSLVDGRGTVRIVEAVEALL